MNKDFWINDELDADDNCKPLKNKRKGIEPPIKPIKERFNHCFFDNDLISLNLPTAKTKDNKKTATRMFFENVKTEESNPLTAKLLMNIEKPDINAVDKTKIKPLFFESITTPLFVKHYCLCF